MEENRAEKVRGHICEGLKEYQNVGCGCIPSFREDGSTEVCDDTNHKLIEFCPFCGEKLS